MIKKPALSAHRNPGHLNLRRSDRDEWPTTSDPYSIWVFPLSKTSFTSHPTNTIIWNIPPFSTAKFYNTATRRRIPSHLKLKERSRHSHQARAAKKNGKRINVRPMWGSNPRPWDSMTPDSKKYIKVPRSTDWANRAKEFGVCCRFVLCKLLQNAVAVWLVEGARAMKVGQSAHPRMAW